MAATLKIPNSAKIIGFMASSNILHGNLRSYDSHVALAQDISRAMLFQIVQLSPRELLARTASYHEACTSKNTGYDTDTGSVAAISSSEILLPRESH
jgi:hypothetical protein